MSNRSSGFSSPNLRPDSLLIRFGPMLMALAGAWFGFANPVLHLPPAILLLPAALILTTGQATSPGQAFKTGMLNSLPAYSASLYWLAVPVHDYGGLPWIVALPCPVLVGGVLAAYAGLFCLGLYLIRLRLSHPLAALLAGLLWASLELARNHFLTGFSWLTLSQSLAPWPWALGLAGWIGAFGLSGTLVTMAHILVRGQGWTRLAALPVVGLCLLPGLLRGSVTSEATASVCMIQGNIDQGLKWDEAMQASILKTYVDLSTVAARQAGPDGRSGPDLVVWPETAMPFYFQDPTDLSRAARQAARDMAAPLLAGAPAYSVPPEPGGPEYVLHNRAYLLDRTGQAQAWYDKEHLVPFGEYVPLSQWLPFMTKLVPGEYEFRPGINSTTLKTGPLSMGLLICYEAIFPELAQQQVALGANVLVNISNDAWFGRTSAPWQHLHLTILRAVEQNRAIIRATNTGISVFIGPDGSLSSPSPLFTSGIVHNGTVPLLTETTFYHEHFYSIHAAFPLLGLALLAFLMHESRVKL